MDALLLLQGVLPLQWLQLCCTLTDTEAEDSWNIMCSNQATAPNLVAWRWLVLVLHVAATNSIVL